ncbi:MAG: LacI family transcriptional regulator [Burkholderiaceae bacterium]|nr:LacI family transcriptional regulator [Burkholderiaceae bacterium]MCD8515871.1 LacI family transcriptional regulator [Burkholderiaceae bacterium]MCD8538108.1 LacI family transcriptional regulator [Burkholderiaceae bacterium]MCD8565715.1 LacI family transcriptional regulator [Burkholderiaceae bacterium]
MSILRIAELTGVSPATVSRVFNRPEQVSETTRELVIRVANEAGYRPNSAARTLRTQRSYVIGVLLPTLRNPVFAECLEGIAQRALEGGYGIMPISSGYEAEQERRAISALLAANVDGLVLTVTDPEHCPVLADLSKAGVPYVLAYNQSPSHVCVGVNSESEVTAVVRKLVANGHRQIAMLSGHLAASDRARSRYQGYLNGMAAAGLTAMPLIEVSFMNEDDRTVQSVLAKSNSRPSAVICSNDLLALRFIRCAKELGLSTPQDISVVGFDGIAVSAEVSPALSTVVQPSAAIGRRAAELVMAQIDGDLIAAGSEPPMPCSFRKGETIRALG